MATTSSTSIASASPEQLARRQLVVFSMQGEHYALPIMAVREIIRHQPPRSVGAANYLIQGVINLRGRVLPICDLSGQMGAMLEIGEDTRILVIDTDGSVVGLIVDSVDEVLLIDAAQIEQLPVAETGLGSEVAKVDDRLIILLDTDRVFAGVVLADAAGDELPDEALTAA